MQAELLYNALLQLLQDCCMPLLMLRAGFLGGALVSQQEGCQKKCILSYIELKILPAHTEALLASIIQLFVPQITC